MENLSLNKEKAPEQSEAKVKPEIDINLFLDLMTCWHSVAYRGILIKVLKKYFTLPPYEKIEARNLKFRLDLQNHPEHRQR